MWRGWLRNGESLEITWPRTPIGVTYSLADTDMPGSRRQLWVGLGFVQAFIPLGWSPHAFSAFEGPRWGFDLSLEFGAVFYWRHRAKSFDWPWDWHTLAYEQQLCDGRWVDVFKRDQDVYSEQHPYTYTLQSGEVQRRTATISMRRHVICYRAFKALGWPRWIKESIDIEFDGEVGERTGSWKGGTIGCGSDIRPGETMLEALRRMERDRKFN